MFVIVYANMKVITFVRMYNAGMRCDNVSHENSRFRCV